MALGTKWLAATSLQIKDMAEIKINIPDSDEILDAVSLLLDNGFIVIRKNQQVLDLIEIMKAEYPPAEKETATGTISALQYGLLIEEACGELSPTVITAFLKLSGYTQTATKDGVAFFVK
jgi:hypothetical protein